MEVVGDLQRLLAGRRETGVTAEGLMAQLALVLLEIEIPCGQKYPLTLWYTPRGDELFGAHDLALLVDPAMHVGIVDLRGCDTE